MFTAPQLALASPAAAQAELDALVASFFGAFTCVDGQAPEIDVLYRLFVPQALIVKRSEAGVEVMTVAQFVEPRRALFASGRLGEFREWEVSQRTDVVGGVAQRMCAYAKAGRMEGQLFEGRGVKAMQLVLTSGGWKISSLSWEDERP